VVRILAVRVALRCLLQLTAAAFPGCTQHHGGPVRFSSAWVGGLLLSFLSRSPAPGGFPVGKVAGGEPAFG
jgi:hypothetical protein